MGGLGNQMFQYALRCYFEEKGKLVKEVCEYNNVVFAVTDDMGAMLERLGVNAKPIEWPIGAENEFDGVIDLVTMKAYHFDGKPEENYTEIEIPADLKDIAEEKRNDLIEAVVEFDEDIMSKYLEGEELTIEEIKTCIRKGTLAVEFFPVMCGTALGNKGVKLLLDAVVDYLPAPTDIQSCTKVIM